MKMIIDGKKRDASDNGIIEVYNPATQQLILFLMQHLRMWNWHWIPQEEDV